MPDEVKILENATVRAIARGFCGTEVRDVGDTFTYSGPLGSWMELVEPDTPVGKAAKEPAKPEEPVPIAKLAKDMASPKTII